MVDVIDLGLVDYGQAYVFQKQRLKLRQAGVVPDTLILCRHHPVFTVGRSGSENNIKVPEQVYGNRGIEVYHIDRGGDVTYHGPGQLIAYPIFDLKNYGRDVHAFLRNLEEVVIQLLDELGIRACRRKGYTGVWVDSAKIASIGIGISRWVSCHGLALNIEVEDEYFSMINPCGLKDVRMTSLSELMLVSTRSETALLLQCRRVSTNPDPSISDENKLEPGYIKGVLIKCLERVFNVSCREKNLSAVA